MGAALFMAVALAVVPCTDVSFTNYDRFTTATVTSVERTNMMEGKRTPIYRVRYTFVDRSGVEQRGESYTTEPPAIDSLPVQYRSSDPSESQLHGMRRKPQSPFILILFTGLALYGLVLGLRQIEYEAGGRTFTTTVKAPTPEPLEDDEREPMLYDPPAASSRCRRAPRPTT